MASIERELYDFLNEDEELKNKVGGFYWLDAPDGEKVPYSVFFQVDDPNEKTLLAYYGGQARIQVSLYDTNKYNIPENRTLVKEKLRSFRGDKDGVKITNVLIANDFTQQRTDELVYTGVIDAIIHWETS